MRGVVGQATWLGFSQLCSVFHHSRALCKLKRTTTQPTHFAQVDLKRGRKVASELALFFSDSNGNNGNGAMLGGVMGMQCAKG